MTVIPWLRAFCTVGTIALVLEGTSRMHLTPEATMLLIAVTWLALSPSYLPAAVRSLTPSWAAAFWAPAFIFTKNGFVSVLVIRPTVMSLFLEPPDDPPLSSLPPQADTPAINPAVPAIAAMPEPSRPGRLPCNMVTSPPEVPGNVFKLARHRRFGQAPG